MAIRKLVWKKSGGFDESLSNNEDYAFAVKLKHKSFNIKFAKNAIVYWIPRATLAQSFIMFYRFAKGDSEAKIFRPKVIFLFFRYILATLIFLAFLLTKSYLLFYFLILVVLLYIVWSILKNYKYVKSPIALIYLPVIQLIADCAVIMGTLRGLI